MKYASSVTFGGGGLQRSAELRDQPGTLLNLWQEQGKAYLFWRGKPLMHAAQHDALPGQLATLGTDHPLVAEHFETAVFLGLDADGAGLFAVDLIGWAPEAADTAQLGNFIDDSLQQHPDLPAGQVFAELRGVMAQLSALDAEIAATAKAVLAWHASHRFCSSCGAPSQMIQGGWQRRCPSCETGHFPRTDPVVIMLITKGDNVLVGRSPGWPEGMYSLLAGFVEPGETLEAAVRREVMEEVGVTVGEVGYMASQPWAFPMSLMIGCWGEAETTEINIDPNEIEDALWVSRQDMMDAQVGLHPKLKPARKGAIAGFLLEKWLADQVA